MLALSAIDLYQGNEHCENAFLAAGDALRTALEQPEQEPVAIPDCGEAGHADGACGTSECLPSFRRKTTPPAAQAAPVQEPVVFYRCNGCGHAYEQVHPTSCDCMGAGGFDRVEYFTTPPAAQRPWVGLTDEDVNRESAPITSQMKLAFHAGMYVAQKILQERNT
jgi:hypothetical protein